MSDERTANPTSTPIHTLPAQLTPLIGRAAELQALLAYLADTTTRLITLTGLGGVGKTRLALEVGWHSVADPQLRQRFADGIHFVSLAGVEEADQLPGVLAAALQLQLEPATLPATQLQHALRERRLLLILDNLDAVAVQADLLATLLQSAPNLTILATSRERLNLAGEWVVELDGLPLPATADADEERRSPAVQLFVRTASAIQPGFDPSRSWPAILDICQQVAGLPLALELAANAVRVYRCEQIAEELRQNLDLLATRQRASDPRHRTLRAVFEQSWRLLSAEEQQLFQQLALFTGSFTLSAASELTGATAKTLADLADKSLVQLRRPGDGEGEIRYQIHPVLRPFLAEKLAAHPEQDQTGREQHCRYYCRLAATQGQALHGAEGVQALHTLQAELENVRAAWGWALAHQVLPALEESLPGLAAYYLLHGPLTEFEQMLQQARETVQPLASAPGTATQLPAQRLLARLLSTLAQVHNERGDYAQAQAIAGEALQVAHLSHDAEGEGAAQLQWGRALFFLGRYEEAQKRLTSALTVALANRLLGLSAAAHMVLGANRLYRGEYTAGQDHLTEALRIYQDLGDLVNIIKLRYNLALTLFYAGDYLAAQAIFADCLEQVQQRQDQRSAGLLLNNLGAVATQLGDYAQAQSQYEAALAVKRSLGDRPYESLILANLGLLATRRQEYQRAVNFCREALQISQELGERATTAYAQSCLGEALIGLGWLPEAGDVLGEAIQIRQELGQADQALEPMAGLAAVYLASGQNSQAQSYVEQILPQLKRITAAGVVDPLRIFWICYEVLAANQDLRAPQVLAEAHTALQARADRISDAAIRQRYLEQVAVNRQIIATYAQVAPPGGGEGSSQWRQRVEQHTDLIQDLERLLHQEDET